MYEYNKDKPEKSVGELMVELIAAARESARKVEEAAYPVFRAEATSVPVSDRDNDVAQLVTEYVRVAEEGRETRSRVLADLYVMQDNIIAWMGPASLDEYEPTHKAEGDTGPESDPLFAMVRVLASMCEEIEEELDEEYAKHNEYEPIRARLQS